MPALNDGGGRGASTARRGERKALRRTFASFGVMGARVAEFLESRLARHHSVRTVEWTESNLRRFLEWCEERSLRNPTEVTRPILERYQRWLFYYRTKAGGRCRWRRSTNGWRRSWPSFDGWPGET